MGYHISHTYVGLGLGYLTKKIDLGVGLKVKVLKKNAESKISYYNAKIRIK